MKFTFNGTDFRIVFRHDPSRMIGDHIGHTTTVMRHDRFGIVTQCVSCRIIIGNCMHSLPKPLRVRKTWCAIQYDEVERRLTTGEEVSGVLLSRGRWVDFVTGCGTPNLDAGDRFNRADGRKYSLEHALNSRPPEGVSLAGTSFPLGTALSEDFRDAAFGAFNSRGTVRL